ncbi:MAG: hypothetical protein JW704_13690, partial [Anaerolineaceae bacterium]|nr:hypothetical protein [Anaerolineaceae bacterium]
MSVHTTNKKPATPELTAGGRCVTMSSSWAARHRQPAVAFNASGAARREALFFGVVCDKDNT